MATGHWIGATVAGHPVVAWEPTGRRAGEAVLFLHDLDAAPPSEHEEWRALFEAAPVPVICPLVGRSWWLSVPTMEFPAGGPLGWIGSEVIPWIEQKWEVKPPHLGLIGVGMGGSGALNLSYRSARRFPVVAAVSAAIDFHRYQSSEPVLSEVFESIEAARQETATLHLHPLNWPLSQRIACDPVDRYWFEGCERLGSKLDSSGIPFDRDFQTTTGGDRKLYDSQQLRTSFEYVLRNLPLAARQL